MAHSKFITIISLVLTLFNITSANPNSEYFEMRASRSESPRVQRLNTPTAPLVPQQRSERSCCSFLNALCILMEHAGSHPMAHIRSRDK